MPSYRECKSWKEFKEKIILWFTHLICSWGHSITTWFMKSAYSTHLLGILCYYVITWPAFALCMILVTNADYSNMVMQVFYLACAIQAAIHGNYYRPHLYSRHSSSIEKAHAASWCTITVSHKSSQSDSSQECIQLEGMGLWSLQFCFYCVEAAYWRSLWRYSAGCRLLSQDNFILTILGARKLTFKFLYFPYSSSTDFKSVAIQYYGMSGPPSEY